METAILRKVGLLGIALVILGVVCLLYGIAIMRVALRKTGFFMVWFILAAAFGVAGWAVLSGTWAALPPLLRDGSAVLPVLLFAVFLVACLHIRRHFHDSGEAGLGYIVVLGAQVFDRGPSIVLLRRLETAADYLTANPETRCIASGGQGSNEPESEAATMKRFLVEQGISGDRIILEDRSTTTRENLAFSRELIGPDAGPIGIVTSDFHMFRALAMARKQGLGNIEGISAPSTPLFLPNNLLRESLAIAKALLKGDM